MSDQYPLSLLDVTWTFLSFQCALAVECKLELCVELALGCLDSSDRAEGTGCGQCLGLLPGSCCSFEFPILDYVSSINAGIHQPSPTRDFRT